ncbi:MAG: extracellular solute-binding protein [Bifidobacteriaceae bacterium]|jgi:ABC-type glycerol-3-phosphate transport system substrate-binding protein|nr:extracellular solute-binding protein [Bifidobacteriaceae bacterium]
MLTNSWKARRVTATAAAIALAALGLAACGTDGGGGQAGDPDKAELTWWSWSPESVLAEQYIADFNKEYPDIKVTYKQHSIDGYDAALRPAIQSSSGPDIFAVTPGSANGGSQVFGSGAIDLTDTVKAALGEDWQEKLAGSSLDPTLTVDGKFVGLAVGAVYSGTLWINQDLFDELGLAAPANLAEWKTVCEALRSADHGCFVHGAGQAVFNLDVLHAIANQVNPGLYVKASRGEAKWNDPDIVKAFEVWKQLFDEGIMQEGALGLQQYPDANNLFMDESYGMIWMGTWYTQNTIVETAVAAMEAAGVTDPEAFTMVPIIFPDVVGDGRPSQMYGDADWALAISANSKNQEAAKTFVTWLTTSQVGQQKVGDLLNQIPSLKGIEPDMSQINLVNPDVQTPAISELYANATSSDEPRLASVSADLNTAIQLATTAVAGGQQTAQEACDELQQKFEAM